MSTVPTQIRIDADIKKQATELFSNLGMDEAKRIFRDPSVKGYTNMEDLQKALLED